MDNLVKSARLSERKRRLERMADGVKQTSHKFKSKKDYNRKDKTWRKEDD